MADVVTIEQLLRARGINFQPLTYEPTQSLIDAAPALGIEPEQVAATTLLQDDSGLLLAIHPARRRLELAAFNREMQRQLHIVPPERARTLLPSCGTGHCLPVAEAYGLDAVVDEALASGQRVYFELEPGRAVGLSAWDFSLLQGPAWYDDGIARPVAEPGEPRAGAREEVAARRARIRAELDRVDRLPAMPHNGEQLLRLSVNPYANANDLAAVIEQDPSLAAQVIRYANSPYYNYRGDVDSVHDAIARVLGFDMVMDVALGIAVGRAFRNPRSGPLGLDSFWRHAIYTAALVQRLGSLLPAAQRPRPGMAYLAGLLHNFGFLLLGHLFPDDFALINKAMEDRPQTPVAELEADLLGVSHQEIGAWLMEAWHMPDEVVIAMREHHNPDYRGPHANYAGLVLIANRLLSLVQLGDEPGQDLPRELLEMLGLTEDDVLYAFDGVMEGRGGLDYMAVQMAA